jgi:GNAT superfamily N-acetyltransferase
MRVTGASPLAASQAGARVSVIRASELSAGQRAAIDARIDAPEHCRDRGACLFWHREAAFSQIFVGVLSHSRAPIGIAYVDGAYEHVRAAWWLDSAARGQGLASAMIDALAALLKADGCTGVGHIAIDSCRGECDAASSSLAARFRSHFA